MKRGQPARLPPRGNILRNRVYHQHIRAAIVRHGGGGTVRARAIRVAGQAQCERPAHAARSLLTFRRDKCLEPVEKPATNRDALPAVCAPQPAALGTRLPAEFPDQPAAAAFRGDGAAPCPLLPGFRFPEALRRKSWTECSSPTTWYGSEGSTISTSLPVRAESITWTGPPGRRGFSTSTLRLANLQPWLAISADVGAFTHGIAGWPHGLVSLPS